MIFKQGSLLILTYAIALLHSVMQLNFLMNVKNCVGNLVNIYLIFVLFRIE